MLVNVPFAKKNCAPRFGGVPVIHADHPPGPVSPPGTKPGMISSPFELRGPSYTFFSAATCLSVRHESDSVPLQSNTEGSKPHFVGSSSTPSFTPSRASHEASAAASMAFNLAGGMKLAGSPCVACKFHPNPVRMCVK